MKQGNNIFSRFRRKNLKERLKRKIFEKEGIKISSFIKEERKKR